MGEIIVALASGPAVVGTGDWALVRVSGNGAHRALAPIIRAYPPAPFTCARVLLELSDAGAPSPLLLPCVALRFDAPRSFTGEDTLELLVPAGPAVVERVLRSLIARAGGPWGGVREARPGEFSARAYLNGKLTLDQAEGVAALIAARSDEQLRAAERLLSGRSGERARAMSQELATLLALVEAGIDFTDQDDVVPIPPAQLAERLDRLIADVGSEAGSAHGGERPDVRPRVVLAGPASAGKSTLFNALLARERSVVSPAPGTTRDVIEEPLDLSRDGAPGCVVTLIDLAGLDEAPPDTRVRTPIEHQAQQRARAAIAEADIVLLCHPSDRPAQGPFLAGMPSSPSAAVLRVLTKADLIPADRARSDDALAVCGLDGWRVGALRRAIADAAWRLGGSRAGGLSAVAPRQGRTLHTACDRLRSARALLSAREADRTLESPELIAGELRAAMDLLGELTGAISPDEVIGRVFATFCVGK